MRIVNTHLVNICQHEDRFVEFIPGLNGVYGRNGTGKSNLLNVGGYANLTNDYRRTNGPMELCVRRGCGPSDPVYHETHWEHNGVFFKIKRDLRRKTHTLTVAGGKTITGDKDVRTWLDETLKVKRQVIDNYLFVSQLQMFNFIDQTPTERSETFSHLCGTTYMQKIYEALGERIKADLPLSADVVDNSDELRQQIGEEKKKVRSAKAGLKEFKPQLLSKEKVKELRGIVEKRRSYRQFLKQLNEAKKVGEERKTAQATTAKALKEAAGKVGTARALLVVAKKQADEINLKAKLRSEAVKKNEGIATAKATLEALKKPRKPLKPEKYSKEFKVEAVENLNDARAKQKRCQAAIRTFETNGSTVCDHCGSSPENLKEHIARCKLDLQAAAQEIEYHREIVQAFEAYESDLADYNVAAAKYTAEHKAAEAKVAELGEEVPLPEKPPKELVKSLNDAVETAEEAVETAIETERRASTAATTAKTRCEENEAQQAKLRKSMKANKVEKDEALAAKKALELHQGAAAQVAVFRERLSTAKAAIAQKDKQLDDIKAAKARTKLVRDWLRDLETMQNEVFFRTKLPQQVNEDSLESLLDTVNETLAEAFGDPFSVSIGAGLSFTAIKPDGNEAAQRLSPGQKAVLAMAFRLAINSIFAAEVGMMVLDEPTVGMDEENISCLQESLETLATFARKRGTQIIIITHDKRLETAFDKVIRL